MNYISIKLLYNKTNKKESLCNLSQLRIFTSKPWESAIKWGNRPKELTSIAWEGEELPKSDDLLFKNNPTDKTSHKRQGQKDRRGTIQMFLSWGTNRQTGPTHTMRYYSAIKKMKAKLPVHTAPWATLKYLMLSKRSQTQEDRCHMISFIWNSKNRKAIETENRSGVWFSKA